MATNWLNSNPFSSNPSKKKQPVKIIADEQELKQALEDAGVDLYFSRDTRNTPVPEVDVKVYFNPVGPKTRRVLDQAGVPEEVREDLVGQTWESVQEDWWRQWTDAAEGSPIPEVFGKKVTVAAVGRMGGHLVVDISLYEFTKETADGETVLDEKKVDRWLKVAGQIKDSAGKEALDDMLAGQLEIDLEHGQFGGAAREWWDRTHGDEA